MYVRRYSGHFCAICERNSFTLKPYHAVIASGSLKLKVHALLVRKPFSPRVLAVFRVSRAQVAFSTRRLLKMKRLALAFFFPFITPLTPQTQVFSKWSKVYCQPLVPSPHIVATCSHTHSYILYISPCGHRNSFPHPLPCFQSYEQLHDMLLVSFLLHLVLFVL